MLPWFHNCLFNTVTPLSWDCVDVRMCECVEMWMCGCEIVAGVIRGVVYRIMRVRDISKVYRRNAV